MPANGAPPRLLFVVTEDWYFWSHRLPVARAARDAGFEVHVAARVSEHGDRIRAEGFHLHPLDWRRRGGGILRELRALIQLWRLYRGARPDLVHHVAIKPVIYGSFIAKLTRRKGVINSINGLGFTFTSQNAYASIARAGLRFLFRVCADGVGRVFVFQNQHDAETFRNGCFIVSAASAVVRGSGVDPTALQALDEPKTPVLTIATVTRMLVIKGVGDVVEASRILRQRGIPHRLLLAGAPDTDNPSSISTDMMQSWAREPGVEWLGHVNEIRSVWSQAHIAVLASHGGEGIPKSLLEAASYGKPIVATNVPGINDIARAGVNAVLVPPHSPKELADALQTLAAKPELRRKYGQAGRHLVEHEFSSDRIAAEMVSMYCTLLSVLDAPNDKCHNSDTCDS